MYYSNFRYLDFWFWFAMCCVMLEGVAAVTGVTQASTMLIGGLYLSGRSFYDAALDVRSLRLNIPEHDEIIMTIEGDKHSGGSV